MGNYSQDHSHKKQAALAMVGGCQLARMTTATTKLLDHEISRPTELGPAHLTSGNISVISPPHVLHPGPSLRKLLPHVAPLKERSQ